MTTQVDFTVTISSANNAFQMDPLRALADIVTDIAGALERGGWEGGIRIRDVNGNTVGECRLTITELVE